MFLRPEFLAALLFWLPLSYFLLKKRTATSGWQSVIAPELLAALSPPANKKHPKRWLIPLLGLLIIIALAGPSIENGSQQTASKGQLFILLDTSLSMTSPDVSPSRLVRAKRIINDWTSSGLFDRSSVIVYSASAHTLTPLTSDSETINTQLQALDPFLMPQFGNQPQTAFTLLQQTLGNLPTTANHLLWLTDDVDEVDVVNIGNISNPFVSKSLIAIGTAEGGVMPISEQQGPLKDSNGNTIITRLNIDKVSKAANDLGFNLGDVTMQPSAHMLGRFNSVQADQTGRADIGYFILIPIAFIFLWRTSAQSLLVCVVIGGSFLINEPSYANELFQNNNQRAYEALLNGDADTALQQTSKPDIQAQALFDKNEFQTATDLFTDLSTADGFYNAANAQAQLGEFEQALALYDQALALEKHVEAQFNKEKIKEFLEQQEEQSESGDGEPQESEDEGEDGSSEQSQSGENPSDGEDIQSPPEQDNANDDQSTESSDQAEEQEQIDSDDQDIGERQQETRTEQAIESVLNQLESDPGSLLQRKFQYQFSQNPTDTDTLEW